MDELDRAGELPVNTPASNGHAPSRPGRQEMRRRRRRERTEGVPFHLDHDDVDVTVRLLNLYEHATLIGLPSEIQGLMLRGFNAQEIVPDAGKRTVEDMFRLIDTEEETANEVAIAGFISPRLVRSEEEADAEGDPDVWWVEDVHLNDRKRYLRLVMGQDAAELARIRRFLREQPLAGLQDHGPDRGGRVAPSPIRPLDYAG